MDQFPLILPPFHYGRWVRTGLEDSKIDNKNALAVLIAKRLKGTLDPNKLCLEVKYTK